MGQGWALNYQNQPLNDILLDLNDQYGLQVSIDADFSRNCQVTLIGNFRSVETVMHRLAAHCNLEISLVNKVYLFSNPVILTSNQSLSTYLFQGQVLEKSSLEIIPYSLIKIGNQELQVDENGKFSVKATHFSESISAWGLGYQQLDTVMSAQNEIQLLLNPHSILLGAVFLAERDKKSEAHLGNKIGQIQFNNVNNGLAPGMSTNLIFNNLRLYPGILAAGESNTDFVIWGSYSGQNRVTYDEITMFNSWGISDDIGRINPYMVKNVNVYKGGYSVLHGDRVGGVVEIDGTQGDRTKLTGEMSLTNQLMSGRLNVPLFANKAALQVGLRKTYFNFTDWSAEYDNKNDFIKSNYDYSDLNTKFNTTFKGGDELSVSYLQSNDNYSSIFERKDGSLKVNNTFEDKNIYSNQTGFAVKYVKNWPEGGYSSFLLTQSLYSAVLDASYYEDDNALTPAMKDIWTNPIEEAKLSLKHVFPSKGIHQPQMGLSIIKNQTYISSNQGFKILNNESQSLTRFNVYVHDQMQWNSQLFIDWGIKATVFNNMINRAYFQPRINGRWEISKMWSTYVGWGVYNQFINKSTIIDDYVNRSDIWQIADGIETPVLKSKHHVLGWAFRPNIFELHVEGYYKINDGLSRFKFKRNDRSILNAGSSKSRGLDIFMKKSLQRHKLILSYSLSEVIEKFKNPQGLGQELRAPQSQKHELKTAAILDFYPLQVTMSNIYGSGFPNRPEDRNAEMRSNYWRTDAAAQFSFDTDKLSIQTGFSLLNITNHTNIRLNQSVNVPGDQIIDAYGVPFTFNMFLNLIF
ncbi:TonB-dependent receptor plug domain-containing protein [Cyclobacteriaceae bacterium]|jgi:hypothetical protein|nr:TonB-dependent receptor plug domain-containing protein [Cyclobacteriaceae bacterium]|tara:strand:+ start:1447 stop:3855 length:2409 start_codon:yes stop_codon:yes gene_type:complete